MQRKVQVWVLVAWLTVCFMVVATIWAQRPGVEEQPTGKQGALLNRLARFSSRKAVVFLDLTGKRLGDEDVETIATFADLRELDLSETNIRDDQLPALAKLRNLQTLRLNKTHLTSAVIPHLEAIHWLNWLEITGDEFPDRLVIGELHRRGKGIYLRERSWDETNRIHSVSVPLGRLLLVRHGNLRMAVKFTKVTKKAQGGAEYVCYWQPAPEGDFASSSLQTVTGEVFEKYRYDPRKEGGQWAINDGGHLFVNIGAIKLEWSSDTIVYLPHRVDMDEPALEVALTTWTEPKKVDFRAKDLQWGCAPSLDYTKGGPEDKPFYLGHAVRAPLGRYVLLRRGADRLALLLTRSGQHHGEAKRYSCYWQSDPKTAFSTARTLKETHGELFEKRRLIKKEGNKSWFEDAGSKLNVDCGPFDLQWSTSAYLYYPEQKVDTPILEIAQSTWTRLEDIDFSMPTLVWYKRK